MNTPREKEHILCLKQGNVASFEWIYGQYNDKLYSFVYKVSRGDTYLCEEVVQSVFIKIWEQKELIDPEKSFSSFLCTIAKNMLSNIYQHKMLESFYQEYVDKIPVQQLVLPDDELNTQFLADYIDKLIDQLPPARRNIFKMSRVDNLSNQEISDKLNMSKNAVELQVSRALAFLREHLSKSYQNFISVLLLCLFK